MEDKNVSRVTKEMTIAEIIKSRPESAGVLMAKGMHCLGCVIAQGETLEQAAEVHGIPVDELVQAINES